MRTSSLLHHRRNVQPGPAGPPLPPANECIAPTGTGPGGVLAATPSQTCRHGHGDKSLRLDRNADAAEGTGGQQKRGWGRERERGRTGLSAERPVPLIPCTRAQNYLQLNDPIHRLDAPPLPTSNTKPQLTSVECLSIVLHHVVPQTDVNG